MFAIRNKRTHRLLCIQADKEFVSPNVPFISLYDTLFGYCVFFTQFKDIADTLATKGECEHSPGGIKIYSGWVEFTPKNYEVVEIKTEFDIPVDDRGPGILPDPILVCHKCKKHLKLGFKLTRKVKCRCGATNYA